MTVNLNLLVSHLSEVKALVEAALLFHSSSDDAEAAMHAENALDNACEAFLAATRLEPPTYPKEPQPSWLYSESEDAEQWSGCLETKEAAIQEGLCEYFGDNPEEWTTDDVLYVARGIPLSYEAINRYLHAADVLQSIDESLGDNEEIHDPEGDHQLEFVEGGAAERELRAWARKHIVLPSWCRVDSSTVERVNLLEYMATQKTLTEQTEP